MRKKFILAIFLLTLSSLVAAQGPVLGPVNGGTGHANSGTFNWGSTNFDFSSLGNGVVINTSGTFSAITPSGTKCYPYLGTGGTGCDTPSGGGGSGPAVLTKSANYTVQSSDWSAPCGWIVATSNTFTITLTSSGTQPASGTCIEITNRGSGEITVSRNGQFLSGQNGSFSLDPGQGALIVSDGTNYEAQMYAPSYNWINGSNSSTVLGNGALASSSGTNNLIFGAGAGQGSLAGAYNVVLGKGAGNQLTSGWANVCIGPRACANGGPDSGSSNVILDEANGGGDAHPPNPGDNNYYDFAGVFWGDRSKGIHIVYGPSNSVSSCGTGPSRATGSNDYTGEITVGTSSGNTCTVSFANTHNRAPFCVVSAHSLATVSGLAYSVSTTALTVTAASGLDSLVFDYVCPTGTTSHVPTP